MFKFKNSYKYTVFLIAIIGALCFVSLFGHMKFNIEALQLRISMTINDRGYTELEIPPLGTIRAHTHSTPVLISVRLENIDLELMQGLLAEGPNKNEVIQQTKTILQRVMLLYIVKLLVLAMLGGAFGVYLTRNKNFKKYITGSMTGIILVGALIAGTYFTYNVNSFLNPQYYGALRSAPWMVSLAQETFRKIETLGEELEQIAANLNQLYERLEDLEPLGETTQEYNILHISDLHNNPAGMDFALRVAQLFAADMIIDTGDISDFGTPLETLLLDQINEINIPYFFIAGNHDSPAIIDKMNSITGVTVINGLVEKDGLRYYGVPDPSSNENSVLPPKFSTIPRLTEQIVAKLDQIPNQVDLLLLHNNKMAHSLAGKAPIILYGHNHQMKINKKKGSIMINAGTSGASGLSGLQANKIPYSLVLLHFHTDEDGKKHLVAADSISVSGRLEQGFSLERIKFNTQEELSH